MLRSCQVHSVFSFGCHIFLPIFIYKGANILNTVCSLFTGQEAEITQLGAISWDGKATFNRYVLPSNGYISYEARSVSGLEIKTDRNQQSLLYKGEEVDAVPVKEALLEFMDWIRKQTSKSQIFVAQKLQYFK